MPERPLRDQMLSDAPHAGPDGAVLSPLPPEKLARRVLILAPTGRDALLACQILRDVGLSARSCGDLPDLCKAAREGAGALVISVEGLNDDTIWCVAEFKRDEPSWSEVPIILLGAEGYEPQRHLNLLGNVTLLDRPLRIAEFVAAAKAALHSRERQYQVRDLLEEIAQAQIRQRAFLSDVLSAVTRGKLRLCDPHEVEEPPVPPLWTHPIRADEDITTLRHHLRDTAIPDDIDEDRWENFLVAVGEASTNALRHGKGGQARFFTWEERVSLRIEDEGPGIALENLPRATLESGYSSARTLGMGFTAIVEFVDSIKLATGVHGTVVTLELHRTPDPDRFLEQLLASYSDEAF